MGKLNGFGREVSFNGYHSIGWRKNDMCHGYNKFSCPNNEMNEEGLYDENIYKGIRKNRGQVYEDEDKDKEQVDKRKYVNE